MIFALIPAGGQSLRMGRPKLSLPLGDRTVLEHVIGALRQAAVDRVLVVVGAHVPELVPLVQAAGAFVLLLSEQTPDMRATIEEGLIWLENHLHPRSEDNWLLVPADHPTLDANIVKQLLRAQTAQPKSQILVPTYRGKRGHPALLSWEAAAGIRALPAHQGINVYVRHHAREVPVQSESILVDLDTPEEYDKLGLAWPG